MYLNVFIYKYIFIIYSYVYINSTVYTRLGMLPPRSNKIAIPNQIVKPPGGNLAYTGILVGGAQDLPISRNGKVNH